MGKIENNKDNWDKIINQDGRANTNCITQLLEYKDLIGLFVKRDFIVYYKQTVLGPLWYLIQPVFSTIIYMIVFGTLAKMSTNSIPQPLFYFAGTMLWTYFSGTITDISNVFYANKQMFGKVYFPRMVVPLATMISLLIKLCIQLVLFLCIYIFYIVKGVYVGVSFNILMFPAVVIWVGILGCGFGMIISSITTRYRDIALALNFLLSLFMYATPVVYPMSQVPQKWIMIFELNPLCAPMELMRLCWFNEAYISDYAIIYSLLLTLFLFYVGIRIFGKIEKTFVDVI